MERDEERIRRLTEAISAAHLDALFCRLPHNVLMLTGYWPVLGTATAILTRDGALALIVPEDELPLARHGWVGKDDTLTFDPVTLDHMGNTWEVTTPLIADVARRFRLARAAIGYEGSPDMIPAPYVALHSSVPGTADLCGPVLPNADFWDASALLGAQRAVLTPREVAVVQRACAIAAHGFTAVPSLLCRGMTEADVAAAVHRQIAVRGASDPDVHHTGVHAFCMSGPRAAEAYRAYARTTNRTIEAGDFVLVHVNAHADGFWTDLTRTYVLGEPSSRQFTMYEAIFEARGRALHAIADGVRAAEVDTVARHYLKQTGFGAAFKHQLGHGVGYGAIYHGNMPRLHPCSDDRLQAGMTFNVEPAIYFEGFGGLRHCDVVTVGTDGARVLSPFQSSLADLIVSERIG